MPSLHQTRGNRGHCLVVARAHVPNIYELPDGGGGPLLAAVSAAATASKRAFAADATGDKTWFDAKSSPEELR
jgi:diadenosine tetraphosphate (Ap4A) HIT family hydrolase